jgi:hypothetical protein
MLSVYFEKVFPKFQGYFLSSVNAIIRLMLSILIWPKVVTLSGFYCSRLKN